MSLEVPSSTGVSSSSAERRVSQLSLLEHNNANNFDFDLSLDVDSSVTPHSQIKQAGEVAAMLVNSRKTFKVDNNIIDTEAAGASHPSQLDDNLSRVSRATLIRVERVKTTLSLKYLMLEQSCTAPSLNEHPGVEGVYNPLQTLRNRKIRAKYKEKPKPLAVKTLPLAVNVFSKHNRHHHGAKKTWKCFWAIDLSEIISDPAWRASHWHELRDPNGNLWFPASSSSSTKNKHESRNRLYDHLFAGDEDDTPSIEEDKMKMIPLNETKAGRRERIKRRMRRNRRHYSASSDVSLDSVPVELKMTPVESSGEATEDDDETKRESAIDGLQIKPLDKREEAMLELSRLEEAATIAEPPKCDAIELDWLNIVRNLNYHQQSVGVGLHFMCDVYPKTTSAIRDILAAVVRPEVEELTAHIVEVNDDSIPGFEFLCTAFLNEIKSLVHIINDDYSIKIDNLLSSSDRTVGELNTSMSLELKKIDERIEKLNNSIFGNVVTEALREKKIIKENSQRQLMYWMLENLIVVVLRLTWVVVNIYKLHAFIVKVIWKIIKVILF